MAERHTIGQVTVFDSGPYLSLHDIRQIVPAMPQPVFSVEQSDDLRLKIILFLGDGEYAARAAVYWRDILVGTQDSAVHNTPQDALAEIATDQWQMALKIAAIKQIGV